MPSLSYRISPAMSVTWIVMFEVSLILTLVQSTRKLTVFELRSSRIINWPTLIDGNGGSKRKVWPSDTVSPVAARNANFTCTWTFVSGKLGSCTMIWPPAAPSESRSSRATSLRSYESSTSVIGQISIPCSSIVLFTAGGCHRTRTVSSNARTIEYLAGEMIGPG